MTRPAPKVGHGPLQMRLVASEEALEQIGDYALQRDAAGVVRFMSIAVPTCQAIADRWVLSQIPVVIGEKPAHGWTWDGNEICPTVRPDLNVIGHWRGFVRGGLLVEA